MKPSKKYDYHIIEEDDDYSVQILRRVSAKKTHVTKQRGGFASREEAQAWGQAEAAALLKNMNIKAQIKRRAKNNEPVDDLY